MGIRERIAGWPVVGTALAVHQRVSELQGGQIASAITLTAFISLFPAVLVGIAVVGFFVAESPDLAARTVAELGLTGQAADLVLDAFRTARESRRAASVVGLAGLAWAGLGLATAVQYAYNAAWQVPGRGLVDRLYGVIWLVGSGLIFLLSFALTAALRLLPEEAAPVALTLAVTVNGALFLLASYVLPHRKVGWKALIPGALLGAVGLEVLKVAGAYWVPRAVARSSALYGTLGVVFAVLAWLLVFGRLVVYAAVLDVVLWERRHGTQTAGVDLPALPGPVPASATRRGLRKPT